MEVRDGVGSDAEGVAALAELPVAAAEQLLRERTVRIAVEDDGNGDDPALRGFVAFDARPGVVYVTQLAGDGAAVERLLEEPAGFARREGMAVEAVLPAGADETGAVESFGFEDAGPGPSFDGRDTVRYRLDAP